MVWRAVALGLTLSLAHEPSCGGVDSSSSGVNAPCTRDKDCGGALTCNGGVCSARDAAPPPSDGGRSDSSPTDAGDDG